MSLSLETQIMKESMKEEKDLSFGSSKSLAKGSSNSLAQQLKQPFPTPSPFSISNTSPGWSSRPPISFVNLSLRLVAFLFSFISAVSLIALSPPRKRKDDAANFSECPELLYCFTMTMLAFAYSFFQLGKGIYEIADRGIIMSAAVSDYTSFIIDQLLVYFLVSSSSVAVPAIKKLEESSSNWRASIISVIFSFGTVVVMAICALLSGYKLCKRIIW